MNVKKLSKEFTQLADDVSLSILAELMEPKIKSDLAGIGITESEANLLIGQVVHWIFGHDLIKLNSFSKNQPNLRQVEHLVKPTAIKVLRNNLEYRALVVCYLRMRNTIFGTLYGAGYLKDPDYASGNEVLDIFGPEFKETPTQDTFITMVKEFYDKRPGEFAKVEAARRNLAN